MICGVRDADPERIAFLRAYAKAQRREGHTVHFPPDDVPQDDPTGTEICAAHLRAMQKADEVHVFWNVNSKGSHFDLGMAYALGKVILPVECELPDPPGKSYWKVMCASV